MASSPPLPQRAIAPAWHTAVVLLVLAALSLAGAYSHSFGFFSGLQRAGNYAVAIVVEWALVAFIGWAGSRRGVGLRELAGGRWARVVDVLRDLGLAIAFLIVAQAVLGGLGYVLKAAPNQAIRNLLPQSASEKVLFVLVAATAGFCEEIIFRGYLQRQFDAGTGMVGGIVLQGLVFGASHGYQGWKYMLLIWVFGILFGLLAHWRGSLRPGILAHFIQDSVGGLVLRR